MFFIAKCYQTSILKALQTQPKNFIALKLGINLKSRANSILQSATLSFSHLNVVQTYRKPV